jgi:hypothetical protein
LELALASHWSEWSSVSVLELVSAPGWKLVLASVSAPVLAAELEWVSELAVLAQR